MKAIQITEYGGPEVLVLRDVPDPQPSNGTQLLAVTSVGVNYADTHQTDNSYLSTAELPLIPGSEVVGTAPDGRRVVALTSGGAYAEKALADPTRTFEVPDDVSDAQALAVVLQGATAWHTLRTSAHMAPGESVVVHAAAGGVGSIAVQLAKRFGAGRVIAAASTDDKRRLTLELGADVTIDSNAERMRDAILEANGGPVDVVLEMIGGETFDASLAAVAPFGRLVTYGGASRTMAKPVHPGALMQRSRGVIGFWLMHCFDRPGMLAAAVSDLMDMIGAGTLRPIVGGRYPLADARRAHEEMLARKTAGKLTLDPR